MSSDEELDDALDVLSKVPPENVPAAGQVESEETVVGEIEQFGEAGQREAKKEVVDYDAQLKGLQVRDREHDLTAREFFEKCLFGLVVGWLFVVLITVWASAITIKPPHWWNDKWPSIIEFELSDSVLIALIGGATVNVIGLLYAVVRYVFPDRNNRQS